MSTDNSPRPDSLPGILRSTSILSLGTFSSRVLGFVRDILLAGLLGTGFTADAFFLAFRIPNMLRSFVGEGATQPAVVPVLSQYRQTTEPQEFWSLVSLILMAGGLILVGLSLAGVLAAPVIVRLMAPGFIQHPDELETAVRLTRLMFPYLVFIGLTAYGMGVLFVFRAFTAPAFSPCLLNIALIVAAVVSARGMDEPVYGLAAGVLIGGLLQLAVLLPPLWRQGFRFQRPAVLSHPGLSRVGKLLLPRLAGAGVYQLNVLVDTICASMNTIVGMGGISAIYFANRIVQLPMGVFGVSLSSAILPALSEHAAAGDTERLRSTLVTALKGILFILLPVSALTAVLGTPMVRLLFERGEFDAYSTLITGAALVFYALGIVFYGGVKILVTALHGTQDTRTPVLVAAVCLVINAVLNVRLMFVLGIGGIALATTLASFAQFTWLLRIVEKRIGGIGAPLTGFTGKIFAATLLSAGGVYLFWDRVPMASEMVKLIVAGVGGAAVYAAAAQVMGISLVTFFRTLSRRS